MLSKEPFLFLHEANFPWITDKVFKEAKFVISIRALLFQAAILIFYVYVDGVPTAASSCAWNSSLNKSHAANRLD